MSNTVKLIMDGHEIDAPEGANLLDAAEVGGIHIPNLCYLKGLKGIGACRMCLVEVEGMKTPMIACTTKAKEGMVVNTKTEAVEEVRKFVTDLIVSMHPLDCMTCTKAAICKLQDYAYDYEIKESTFSRKKGGFGVDDRNPFIKFDPDYCVLCQKCVRICKHQSTNILDFKGRGVGTKVIAGADQPLHETDCTFCGSCIDVCPVNAILEADRWRKGREWDYEKIPSACTLCGVGCEFIVHTDSGMVRKISAGQNEGASEWHICAFGRFGFDSILADNRIAAPLKRVNNELVPTTWEEAISIVAGKLKESGENSGFVTSAGIVNEDALTLKKFANDVVKTKNLDSTASLYGDEDTLISATADIESADVVVLVDLDLDQWNRALPALDSALRKKINLGAKLITIKSTAPRISDVASVNLTEDEAGALKALAKALIDKGLSADRKLAEAVSGATVTEAVEKAASLYVGAKNPVILTSPAMYPAAANIGLIKGSVVSVPLESNAKGVIMMGISTEGKSYKEMTSGGLGLLYVTGEIPLTQRPDVGFLVVQASHLSKLAGQADIVLPSAAYLEQEGTIIDFLGRTKQVRRAVEPTGEALPNNEIFMRVAKAMGRNLKEAKESEVKKFTKVKLKASFHTFERREFDARVDEMIETLNASIVFGSRLLWLKEKDAVLV